jgi:glycosyltransferase involved in cell wall biosynthesis
VTLTFIGSENPDYGEYLRRLAKELDVEEAVTFAGHVPDPLAMIRDAVVVVCSRREGFGRVAIEAMKCGRPVIAAGSETAKEFIRDNWNGLTYRVGDARDLAKQVESIFEDQELRVRIANTGQQWAMKTFTTERHVREFMAVASEAVDGKAAGE